MKLYQAGGWRLWRRRARGGGAGFKSRAVAMEPLDGRVLFATTALAAAAADFSPVALAAPVNVSHAAGYQGEGSIAVDPTNPSRVFTTSETDAGGILVASSTDGGATWTTRTIANGSDQLPVGDKNPQAVFDAFGNLYVSYLETTAQRAIKIVTSSDGGVTFAPLYALAAPGIDQPSIAVGGDSAGAGGANVWITYRNGTGGISASGLRSTGLGTAQIAAFSSPQTVPGAVGNFGDIAVGPSGEVVVSWQTNTGGEGAAQIQVSTDADGLGPGGFSAPLTASNTNVGGFDFLPAQPVRAIDAEANLAYDLSSGPGRGRLYLVYTDESPDEGNDFNVFVRASTDNGASWGAPVRVNDDATTRSQFLPDVAVDPTSGKLAVGWYDARDDAGVLGTGSTDATANNDVRYWGAVSGDGGVSFQNVPVASGVSNAAAAGGLSDFGDYSAVAAYGGRAYFGWADNSPELAGNPNRPRMDWAVASGAVSVQAGPRVVSATPSGDTFSAVDHIDFTYDRPMDPSTYSLTDVVSFVGPSGAIKSAITTGTWLDGNRTLRLAFLPQSTPGVYTLALGADIRSVAGDRSDNNVNGTAGEVPEDRFIETFTIAPPRVTASAPASPKVGTAGNFDFTFNQPMDPTSFAVADDLVSFTGPGGVDLRPAVTGFSWLDGNRTLRVNFDKQGGDGNYAMTIGANVLAAAAPKWAMDQDGDFAPGEAGADAYTAALTIDRSTGPDSFGYEAWTNAALSLDLSPTGTGVVTAVDNTDDGAAQVPLGTNTFNFYGGTYTGSNQLFVSSNGLITFGGGETSFQNGDLTDVPARATIAPLWDDWRTDIGTDSRVLYRFDDTNADGTPDRLVVEWNSVPNSGGSSTNPATFQAVLQLNSNGTPGEILFNYPDLDVGAASLNNGAGATVGIRDAAGNGDGRRLAVSVNVASGPYLASGKAIRIATTPQPQQPPSISSLTDVPDAVRTGGSVTLTANNVIDVDGAIANVAFYRESNGTTGLQTGDGGDTPLGTDASSAGGYSVVAPNPGLPDGTYIYYAVATDDDGAASNVAVATGRVDNTPPTVSIVPVSPDPRLEQLSTVTVKFSEAVTGVTLSDFTLTRNGGPNFLTSDQNVSTSDGGVTWTLGGLWSDAAMAGNYVLTLNPVNSGITDLAGNALTGGATESWRKDAAVVGRMTFYNQSNYDRINPAADISDDIAIAADKQALLPGQKGSFANVTSYSRGINGIMIDLFGIVGTPSAADFTFRVGTTGDPSKWAAGPAPTSILLRKGAGAGDSDRLALAFPTGSIVNKWLQVTMKATAVTGLGKPDVFYFGNLVGETGNAASAATSLTVDARDVAAERNQLFNNSVLVTSRYDFNRDGKLNATDLSVQRSNINDSLPLITAPSTASAASAGLPVTAPVPTYATPQRTRTSVRSELLLG